MFRCSSLLAIAALAAPAYSQSVSGSLHTGIGGSLKPQIRGTNVLIVLADDMSIDTLPLYALDPSVPPDLTPNIDALAQHGVLFLNAYSNPLCSPTRAALLTGMNAHRSGIGAVIESSSMSLPQTAISLGQALRDHAPVHYETAAYGKWHLESKSSATPCPTLQHGFDSFDGTLYAEGPFYCNWDELLCPGDGTTMVNPDYMTSALFDQAIAWIDTRQGPWLCYFAPESPYHYPHFPPTSQQSIVQGATCDLCDHFSRTCWNAAVQAFDTKLGELVASLGPGWWNHTTIVFTADNGTPNNVNTFWPNGAKGKLTDGGVHVPLIIAGRAVAPGRRGSTEDGLVQLTDLYRTITRKVGIQSLPAGVAADSVDLGPLLRDPPGGPVRSYAFAEKFSPNAPSPGPFLKHEVMIRDTRYKLHWDESAQAPVGFYDLQVDPLELNNLVLPQVPAPGTPEGDAFLDLVGQIAIELGS